MGARYDWHGRAAPASFCGRDAVDTDPQPATRGNEFLRQPEAIDKTFPDSRSETAPLRGMAHGRSGAEVADGASTDFELSGVTCPFGLSEGSEEALKAGSWVLGESLTTNAPY
jgi:hypothetical protein